MAKGRLLHQKISFSDQVNNLPDDTCRLLYTWIIPHLDIEGRFYGDAIRVKSAVFPLRKIGDKTIEKYLLAMEEVGLIVRYEIRGQKYIWAPTFSLHQTLRKDREQKSLFPSPPEETVREYGKSRYGRYMCLKCGFLKELCECEKETEEGGRDED